MGEPLLLVSSLLRGGLHKPGSRGFAGHVSGVIHLPGSVLRAHSGLLWSRVLWAAGQWWGPFVLFLDDELAQEAWEVLVRAGGCPAGQGDSACGHSPYMVAHCSQGPLGKHMVHALKVLTESPSLYLGQGSPQGLQFRQQQRAGS